MELIDRYVTEVGRHLPRKNRLDIETELRSTLEDMLEDRSQQAGRPADEALAAELLEEYGAPRKVAATYQTHPYLIGPRMFSMYTFVLKIVLFAVTLGLTIATVVSLVGANMSPPEVLGALGEFIASLVSALLAAFGNVTLVFAILERVMPEGAQMGEEKWTPAELSKVPSPNRVKTADMVASILFMAAGLLIFNFYPQIVGMWTMQDGTWTQAAGLTEAFFRYLPWINLSGILTIALDLWLLRQGTWDTLTRLAHIGLQIVGIAIAAAMLRGPALVRFSASAMDPQAASVLTRMFDLMVPFILGIVVVVSIIEIVKDVVRMLRPGQAVYPFEKSS